MNYLGMPNWGCRHMTLKAALLGTALSLAAFSAANATVVPLDELQITIGNVSIDKIFTTETASNESWSGIIKVAKSSLPNGFNFTSGTVFLTEPTGSTSEKDGSIIKSLDGINVSRANLSDVLTITKISTYEDDSFSTDYLSNYVYFKINFVSDGASEDAREEFPLVLKNYLVLAETGSLQDVSSVFGSGLTVQVLSDVDPGTGNGGSSTGAPELSTWMMLLLGFAGIGSLAYRRARKNATAMVAA
jgi:hypothetical protein